MMTLTENQNELLEAIKSGDQAKIEVLLTPNSVTKKSKVSMVDFREMHGDTVLHVAVNNGKISLIDLLIKLGADLNETNKNGYTPFHLAIKERRIKTANKLLSVNPNLDLLSKNSINETPLDSAIQTKNFDIIVRMFDKHSNIVELSYDDAQRKNIYKKLFKLAIEKDSVEFFRKLIVLFVPTKALLDQAKGKIKELLDYKPARREQNKVRFPTIREYATDSQYTTDLSKRSKFLGNLLYDQENTSDEESSDSESDDFEILIEEESLAEAKIEDKLARGFHFCPEFFKANQRKEAKSPDHHKRNVYSQATTDLARLLKNEAEHANKSEKELIVRADELVKAYFELLKITPDKEKEFTEGYEERRRQIGRKEAKFDSLYYRFIQAYVNPHGYDDLFNKGGAKRNFNFFGDKNPIVSATPSEEVACRYASGERITGVCRFIPKIRYSTGLFKHRRLGYVEVYIIDEDYRNIHAINIDQLKADNKISVAHNQGFNKEVIFKSSIPKEAILGYQIFSLPSMRGEWNKSILEGYGIKKDRYDSFKETLLEAKESDSENLKASIKEFIKDITKKQAERLNLRLSFKVCK